MANAAASQYPDLVESQPVTLAQSDGEPTLPATGSDTGLVLVVAALAVAFGVLLRRVTRGDNYPQ